MTNTNTAIPTSAEVGQRLRIIAHLVARAIAFLWVAAEATYRAGYRTGQFVHWLNDRLVGVVAKFGPVPSDEELMQFWGAEVLTSDALDAEIERWDHTADLNFLNEIFVGEQPAVK